MVAALLLIALLSTTPQATAQGATSTVANTKGLTVGVHLNGSTISSTDRDNVSTAVKERASGVGAGGEVGWGITKWLLVYAGGDAAKVKIKSATRVNADDVQPDYTLIHADIGARVSFPSANHAFVPFVNAALTRRRASTTVENQDISLSGNGFTVGGGGQYFFTSSLALDVGLQYSIGDFTDIEVAGVKYKADDLGVNLDKTNSARINAGMKFYPHFGKK